MREAETELAQLAVPERPKAIELMPRAEAAYREMVGSLPGMLAREPDKARAVLARVFRQIKLRRTAKGGIVAVLETTPTALWT